MNGTADFAFESCPRMPLTEPHLLQPMQKSANDTGELAGLKRTGELLRCEVFRLYPLLGMMVNVAVQPGDAVLECPVAHGLHEPPVPACLSPLPQTQSADSLSFCGSAGVSGDCGICRRPVRRRSRSRCTTRPARSAANAIAAWRSASVAVTVSSSPR